VNTLIHSYCPAIALDSCINDKRRDQKELSVFYAALGLQYPDGLSPEHAAACWLREIAYLA